MSSRLEITRPSEGNSLFYWVVRFWERRRFLAELVATAFIGSVIVALLLPAQYTSKVVLLPSGKQDKMGVLSGLASSMGFDVSGATTGLESSSLLYPEILKSRLIGEAVLFARYRYTHKRKPVEQTLLEYLKAKNLESGLRKLASLRQVAMDVKTGIITLAVTTGRRELSALVANQFVTELERYNRSKRKTKALNHQKNLERRLDSVKVELAQSENQLESFLEKNRNFAVSDDPELNRELARLKREVGIKSETYMTLTQQYELAKIETEKEIPIVQVLDAAVPALKKSAPKRTLLVLTTTAAAFTFGLLWFFVRDLLTKKFGPVNWERLAGGWKDRNTLEGRLEQGSPAQEK
ncbi:MAG: GNVR domain-containing protein [Candidatus Zixiibacteriota bacterium]